MEDRDRRFFRHFWTYVAVSTILFLINVLFVPNPPWFLWVMMVWGIVIVIHAAVSSKRDKP